jgi:hypothetical protein
MLDLVAGLLPANRQSLIGVKGSYLKMTPSLPGIPLTFSQGDSQWGLKMICEDRCSLHCPLGGTF